MFHARRKHIEVHYHFVRERVLSSEVKPWYIRTDRHVADIFTKSLGCDKLQHFSEMLGLHHLDLPHLRGRIGGATEKKGVELNEEFSTSDRVRASGKGGKIKKDITDGKIKAKIRTWSDMVKVLKIEDELETTNSNKSGDESEAADSVEQFDSEEPNHLKAKRTKGQRKGRQHHDNKVAGKGRTSNQADRKVEACGIERVEECEQGRVGCELKKNLKLSFRGSVEIQAQHWPDLLHKLRTGSVWQTERLRRVESNGTRSANKEESDANSRRTLS